MNKVYMIEILCKDTDNTIYNDNHRIGYTTFEKAKQELDKLIKQEYEDLNANASENTTYSIEDYNDNGNYEREIHIETEEYEDLLTRYTIVEIEIKGE